MIPKDNLPSYVRLNCDFASLYPGIMIPIDKSKFRRQKIELLIKKINDNRTN